MLKFKMMRKFLAIIMMWAGLIACSDDNDVLVSIPNDVTMNELELGRFTHRIPESGFTSKAAHTNGVKFNTVKNSDGTYSGFAYSNRNNRSFTWTATQEALDSNIYSVYTRYPNANEVYAVACVKNDDAYFTLEKPAVVEHILVANTTYAYLAMVYGDQYGTPEAPVANPNIPGSADKKGVWYSNVPGGVKKLVDEDKDYFKLIIKGFKDNTPTGTVNFYLCTRKGDPENPDWSRVVNDWYPVDLSALGVVDKIVFDLESTDIEAGTGRMRTPAYFCLDGIRIQE